MTASLPPVQPASPQPATAAPSTSGSAAPDVPFSQVLSGEIAQQRGRPADAPDSDTDAASDEATPADTASATPAANLPPDRLPGAVAAAADSANTATASTSTATPTADTLLAIAQNPDLLKPDSTATGDAANEPASAPRSVSPFGTDTAARNSARTAWADARNARSDAAAQAADDTLARSTAAETAALAARTDSVRSAERLPDFMAALNQAQASQVQTTQAASTAATPLQASDRLSPQLGTPAWNQALGEKIVWMAAGSQQSATLTLNPPDLGPLQVVLNVSNDQASAHFFAAQPEVRQALEAALPRLREMMQDAGIQLGQANVSADTARQQDSSPRDTPRNAPGFSNAGADAVAEVSLAALPVRTGRGLVDTFA
jgi:flagellar hook-length control protein FliK